MRKTASVLLLLAVIFGVYWFFFRKENKPEGPKQPALTVKRHSDAFNGNIDSLVQYYSAVKDAFAAGDSGKAKTAGTALIAFAGRLNLDELKKDTAGIFESAQMFVNDIKSNAEAMQQSLTITDMRQDFKAISENMYPLLKTIHYEGQKLYWQTCPMAFGEGMSGNWLSNTVEIINPYLGKNHPECGEIQDTIKAL